MTRIEEENAELRKALSELSSRHTQLVIKYYDIKEKYNKLLRLEQNLKYYKENLDSLIEKLNK